MTQTSTSSFQFVIFSLFSLCVFIHTAIFCIYFSRLVETLIIFAFSSRFYGRKCKSTVSTRKSPHRSLERIRGFPRFEKSSRDRWILKKYSGERVASIYDVDQGKRVEAEEKLLTNVFLKLVRYRVHKNSDNIKSKNGDIQNKRNYYVTS